MKNGTVIESRMSVIESRLSIFMACLADYIKYWALSMNTA